MPNIRELPQKMGDGEDTGNSELKWRAVRVTAQLPDDLDDALKVLALARRIVVEFLED